MNTNELAIISITDLMRETAKAHAQANSSDPMEDADWPLWYADYLVKPLSMLLDTDFTQSQLVHCLIDTENERLATQPDSDWAQFYGTRFAERYAGTDTPKKDHLALYMTPTCPFCLFVLNTIGQLNIDVELRDVSANANHYEDLVKARKRATVPVLRITTPDGASRWMPESRDIAQYLVSTYG